MNKNSLYHNLYRTGIVLIILIILGAAGWYVFLKRQQITLSEFLSARGIGSSTPLAAPTGSTRTNILSGFLGGLLGDTTADATKTTTEAPRLWQVSAAPATALHFSTEATSTTLFFAERPTGNLFSATASTSAIMRLSNTTIPHVYEGVWANDHTVLLQYRNDANAIDTFSGTVVATSTEDGDTGTLTGTYLEQGIAALTAATEAKGDIFYLLSNDSGVFGITADSDGGNQKQIWQFPIRGWNVSWNNPKHITLTQYTSSGVLGSAYALSLKGSLSPIVTGIPGLSLIENAAGTALYSSTDTSGTSLYRRNTEGETLLLPLKTLAEKCVWSPTEISIVYCAVPTQAPSSAYPDSWYRGEEYTVDAIWRIDTKDGVFLRIFDSRTDSRTGLDILKPTIDASGKYIGFLDARTRSAWMLRIAE